MTTKILHSFAELGEHLNTDKKKLVKALEKSLGEAAKAIQENAQEKIGEYQETAGPYPAWEPLAESTEAAKARHGYPADAPLLASGGLRDSIEAEHKGLEAVVGTNDPTAAYQEFGTASIPPRSFLGAAAFEQQEEIQKLIGKAIIGAFTEK